MDGMADHGWARAAGTAAGRDRSTLASRGCSHHIPSLAPAVALPAPRHDRRRTGAAGSPPGGFPFVEADALCRGSLAFAGDTGALTPISPAVPCTAPYRFATGPRPRGSPAAAVRAHSSVGRAADS